MGLLHHVYQPDCWGKQGREKVGSKNGATGSVSGAVPSMHVNFHRSSEPAAFLELCMQHHDTETQSVNDEEKEHQRQAVSVLTTTRW